MSQEFIEIQVRWDGERWREFVVVSHHQKQFEIPLPYRHEPNFFNSPTVGNTNPSKSILDEILTHIETTGAPRISRINNDIKKGRSGPDELVSELVDWLGVIDTAVRQYPRDITPLASWRAIEFLQRAMLSLEEHFQGAGLPPGMALALLPKSEELLSKFSAIARFSPADSVPGGGTPEHGPEGGDV